MPAPTTTIRTAEALQTRLGARTRRPAATPRVTAVADPSARLAVLIDADNTSPSSAALLLEELARYGVPTVKRAYGDWTSQQLTGWKDVMPRHAIQPMQQFANTRGKNATDSALIIDAMDLLYAGNLDAFALVSSDSDFTRLATRIRESGKTVYGLGRRRTPASLIAACDRFIFLEVLGKEGTKAEPDTSGEDAEPLPDLREIVTAALQATAREDGWATLGALGQFLGTAHASFDSRNYGFSRLGQLVNSQDWLEVEDRESAPLVRLLPSTPAKKTAAKATTGAGSTTTTTRTRTSTGTRKRGSASKGA